MTERVAGCYRGALQPLCQCQQLPPISQYWQSGCLSLLWVGSTVLRLMPRCGCTWYSEHVTLMCRRLQRGCLSGCCSLLFREDGGFDQSRRPDLTRCLPHRSLPSCVILWQQSNTCLPGICATVTGRALRNALPRAPWSLLSMWYAPCSDLFLY